MVTLNGQIYRVDVKGGFIDIRQAFDLGDGKVVLQFRNYDKTRPTGQRITNSIDFFMDIDEFLYFCDLCKTGRIYYLLEKNAVEAQQNGKAYPAPGYHKLGGFITKDGKVISRQFKIEGGYGTNPVFFKALQGPGRKTETGLYAPAYKDNSAEIIFRFKVSDEDIRKLGLMGEKAVDVFHIWSAQGRDYLKQRCEALSFHKDGAKKNQYQNHSAPQNQPYANQNDMYMQQEVSPYMPYDGYNESQAAMPPQQVLPYAQPAPAEPYMAVENRY